MRRYLQQIWLLAAFIIPMSAAAQGSIVVGDLDTYLALLSEECPIEHFESWAVNAIEADGDTVRAELQIPSSLTGFLPKLTGPGDNVKKLWFRQLKSLGYPWADLTARLIEAGRPMVLTLHPKGARGRSADARIIFTSENLAAFAENDKPSPAAPEEEEPVEEVEIQPEE